MPEVRKVIFFTREFPPHNYGGAGVHVEHLSRALSAHVAVEVRCFGEQELRDENLHVHGYPSWDEASRNTDQRFAGALDACARSLAMARDRVDADIVHLHTWYTHLGGLIARPLWDVPVVLTTHSLEPLRPWKEEQLGRAYRLSSWLEKVAIEQADAVIAVSAAMRSDVLRLFPVSPEKVHVIHNGIDPIRYRKVEDREALLRHGVDPGRPYVLFVGRLARQKGILHLAGAIPHIDPSLQVVLVAGTPDTAEIAREVSARIEAAGARHSGVVWIQQMLPPEEVIQFYSHAAVFCCPSVYEPFGLINLEAMACGTPVVASAVGGIPEVVMHGQTGFLVDPELDPGSFEPASPEGFARKLAEAVNRIGLDAELRERLGRNGRRRVEEHFSWGVVAAQTLDLYRDLLVRRSG